MEQRAVEEALVAVAVMIEVVAMVNTRAQGKNQKLRLSANSKLMHSRNNKKMII